MRLPRFAARRAGLRRPSRSNEACRDDRALRGAREARIVQERILAEADSASTPQSKRQAKVGNTRRFRVCRARTRITSDDREQRRSRKFLIGAARTAIRSPTQRTNGTQESILRFSFSPLACISPISANVSRRVMGSCNQDTAFSQTFRKFCRIVFGPRVRSIEGAIGHRGYDRGPHWTNRGKSGEDTRFRAVAAVGLRFFSGFADGKTHVRDRAWQSSRRIEYATAKQPGISGKEEGRRMPPRCDQSRSVMLCGSAVR